MGSNGVIGDMRLKVLLGLLSVCTLAGCEGYSGGGFYGEGPEMGVEQPAVIVTGGGYGGYGHGYNHGHYYGHGDQHHYAYVHGGNEIHGHPHQSVHAQYGGNNHGHK